MPTYQIVLAELLTDLYRIGGFDLRPNSTIHSEDTEEGWVVTIHQEGKRHKFIHEGVWVKAD